MKHIPRFFINSDFHENLALQLSEAQKQHVSVLRMSNEDEVRVFNPNYGEWRASITNIKKGLIAIEKQLVAPRDEPGTIVACGLINPNKFAFVLEKSTELGVSKIIPIITKYSQYNKINRQRSEQIIVSACEQSRRLTIPTLEDVTPLSNFLNTFPKDYSLLIGDENPTTSGINNVLTQKCVFLIGPEGGFADEERQMFSQYDFIKTFHFGHNILRTETAVVAFVSCWNAWNFN